jgi:hypothetical protein
MSAASGMPCTLPLGEVSGVFMSVCASIQMQSDLLVLAAEILGDARHRARGHRVIAAEDERNFAGFERLQYQVGAGGAGGGDFLEIFGVSRAFFFLLGNGDGDVAGVFDNVADGFEAASSPATRTAEGPMSTPRRDCPRSRGTPITRIWRG